jgi:hypothetical protein
MRPRIVRTLFDFLYQLVDKNSILIFQCIEFTAEPGRVLSKCIKGNRHRNGRDAVDKVHSTLLFLPTFLRRLRHIIEADILLISILLSALSYYPFPISLILYWEASEIRLKTI